MKLTSLSGTTVAHTPAAFRGAMPVGTRRINNNWEGSVGKTGIVPSGNQRTSVRGHNSTMTGRQKQGLPFLFATYKKGTNLFSI